MSGKLSDEIGTMLGDVKEEVKAGTEAPSTDAPAAATEAPSTDAPAVATEAPASEAPTTDAPEELDELELLKQKNIELTARLEDLSGRVKLSTKAPETEAPSTDAPQELIDFLGDRGVDDVTSDKQMFNEFLNEVARRAVDLAGVTVSENVLRAIPDIVKTNVQQHAALRTMTDDFYRENEDLKGHKKFVGMVGAELASKNPDWKVEKVFSEAASESRKRLGMKKAAVKKVADTKPTLPGGTKGVKGAPDKAKAGKLAKEIDDMLSAAD